MQGWALIVLATFLLTSFTSAALLFQFVRSRLQVAADQQVAIESQP
jgi:hypothetical protein